MRGGLVAIPLGLIGVGLGIGFWVFMVSMLFGGDDRPFEAQAFVETTGEATTTENRTSCDEIFGTAFRSVTERQWFIENCTMTAPSFALPAPSAPGPAPAQNRATQPSGSTVGSPPPAGVRTDCNQIRGTPYTSDAERAWYLANCNQTQVTNPGPGPDRTDCNEIRGTAYRSDNERRWFLANCGGR
jgi:hypothetical protein